MSPSARAFALGGEAVEQPVQPFRRDVDPPPQLVGTMLTVQTCAGFLLTLITIHLMPIFIEDLGWNLAFAPLAIGPFLGIVAMARLKRRPEAAKLAGGRG